MTLTPLGAQAASFGHREREELARQLILGFKDITYYMHGVCYDAVAYVMYLLNPEDISETDFLTLYAQNWVPRFKKTEWSGGAIPEGTGVGFYREIDGHFFHAALAVGGTRIRAINGHLLGAGWLESVELTNAITRNDSGTFDYDGTTIKVFLLSF